MRSFVQVRSEHGAAAPATASSAYARSVYIKTYGCQMNVSDTELVRSILIDNGYTMVEREAGADVVLLNTCAIREKAEAKIWGKLRLIQRQAGSQLMAAGLPSSGGAAALQQGADTVGRGSDASGRRTQVVGLLGCMAERLKDSLLESGLVQVIAGAPFAVTAQRGCSTTLRSAAFCRSCARARALHALGAYACSTGEVHAAIAFACCEAQDLLSESAAPLQGRTRIETCRGCFATLKAAKTMR